MNGLCQFRLCELSNEELINKIDSKVDTMYQTGVVPSMTVPANPDDDLDLLIGELLLRFIDLLAVKPIEDSPLQ